MKFSSLFKMTKGRLFVAIILAGSLFIYSCNHHGRNEILNDEYYVAAYIWPSCHHDERFGDMLWPEGTGEWEVIKKGTPRFEGHYQPRVPHKGKEHVTYHNKSPESFAAFLQKAKEYCDERTGETNLITLFSWNEWVEGSYLLPDMKYGFSHLEAVRRVISGEYDLYSK